ncbi:hypothetical protein GGS23DRAFT_590236 [Durotheca rogersii]|uniref:uncharacterized protein n=1 Tax=Durotheca rogersii TaxID=419775 RepID=UPI002220C04B|nr:uncharacterized protein GGS23DRAFT_590236 [Durotheca rogersii]KAI5855044.1 hypothetical protein GGS23DRAFT_590236 [Durotheca rogersii]
MENNRRSQPLCAVYSGLHPKKVPSTIIIPRTAEGNLVPLDNSTAAHRTATLRQLSNSQPSARRQYGAGGDLSLIKSTTGVYSQPVVVRTYSSTNTPSSTRGQVSVPATPTSNGYSWRPSRDVITPNITHKGNEKSRVAADLKLPSLQAFTFKGIMADIQEDVIMDLDQIAEICAGSRFSLSDQYEVHITTPTSRVGANRPSSTPSLGSHTPAQSILQAMADSDECISVMRKRRKGATRQRNTTAGTLETIISSSQSSNNGSVKRSVR